VKEGWKQAQTSLSNVHKFGIAPSLPEFDYFLLAALISKGGRKIAWSIGCQIMTETVTAILTALMQIPKQF
jgi:hypothetical protein